MKEDQDFERGGGNVIKVPPVIVEPVITNSYEKKVLLITNHFSKKTTIFQKNISPDVLYNLLLQIKTVEVTVLDAYDPCLDNTTLSYLRAEKRIKDINRYNQVEDFFYNTIFSNNNLSQITYEGVLAHIEKYYHGFADHFIITRI